MLYTHKPVHITDQDKLNDYLQNWLYEVLEHSTAQTLLLPLGSVQRSHKIYTEKK